MKKLILIIAVAAAAASCRISDPQEPNQLNEQNISNYCRNLFEEEVSKNLICFYNACQIARFLDADAEAKVSPEFDLIRTGLSYNEDSYTFDYDDYSFSGESSFLDEGVWKVIRSYYQELAIIVCPDKEWTITVSNTGTVMKVKLVEEDAETMKMSVRINGIMTENSEYSAEFEADSLEVTICHKSAGKIESMTYDGEMTVRFMENTRPRKTCVMEMIPGMATSYAIM